MRLEGVLNKPKWILIAAERKTYSTLIHLDRAWKVVCAFYDGYHGSGSSKCSGWINHWLVWSRWGRILLGAWVPKFRSRELRAFVEKRNIETLSPSNGLQGGGSWSCWSIKRPWDRTI